MEQLQRDLLNLRDISTQVENYLVGEQYLSNYGPIGTTTDNILGDCYGIVMEELQQMGIVFWDTENSILADWWIARIVYHLRYLFDKNNFFRLLDRHRLVIPAIETIVTSAEGDDSNLLLILETLYHIFPENEHIYHCFTYSDYVISNTEFDQHVLAILDRLKRSPELTIDDPQLVKDYILKISAGREQAAKAIATLKPYLASASTGSPVLDSVFARLTDNLREAIQIGFDWDQINRWVTSYDLDKIRPSEIQIFTLVDRDNVRPELEKLATEYMDMHHKRSPHHVEYWLYRITDCEVPKEAILLLVAHHYEDTKSWTKFKADIDTMLTTGQPVFTNQDLELIDKCCTWLYPNHAPSE